MMKLLRPVMILQRSVSRQSARAGALCAFGALLASCAVGSAIEDEDVIVIPSARPNIEDPSAPGATDGVEPAGSESTGDGALQPGSEENDEGLDGDLPRAEQPEDDDPSSQPEEDDGQGSDSEPLPPVDVPIIDTEPDDDDDDPIPPVIQPDPAPVPPPVDDDPPAPVPTPVPTNPNPVPELDPDPIPPPLPAAGHCLAGWEGSSCDSCSGQTQSDRLACRVFIDCYITSDCDPATCGGTEQVCGVNRLGNGFAPKDIADTVYACMCAP